MGRACSPFPFHPLWRASLRTSLEGFIGLSTDSTGEKFIAAKCRNAKCKIPRAETQLHAGGTHHSPNPSPPAAPPALTQLGASSFTSGLEVGLPNTIKQAQPPPGHPSHFFHCLPCSPPGTKIETSTMNSTLSYLSASQHLGYAINYEPKSACASP